MISLLIPDGIVFHVCGPLYLTDCLLMFFCSMLKQWPT